MEKKSLLIQAPVTSRSGYGDHSRDIAYSLIKLDKYDIQILPTNWGNTSTDGLDKNDEKDVLVSKHILTNPVKTQPDIFIQISIPNEFKPVGKELNIGITAGIETTQCAPEWIEGLNKMTMNIVPSEFSKKVFTETKYEVKDKNTDKVHSILELTSDIKVLFEGVDTDIFASSDKMDPVINEYLDNVPEEFLFLCVGHWLAGDFGEDRKNISGLVYSFLDTFKNTPTPPALLLKTSGSGFSIKDKERIINKISAIKNMFPDAVLPTVYLLHGNLSKQQMNSLYRHEKVKAMLSYTKGEGFGRPLLEFAITGKPVLASGFSGHVDFLNPAFHTLLPGELKEIHKSAVWNGVLIEGSKWFNVDYSVASKTLLDVFKSYKKYKYESEKFIPHANKWSLQAMAEKLGNILDEYIDKNPSDNSLAKKIKIINNA